MAESFSVKALLSAKDYGFSSTFKDAIKSTETLGDRIKNGVAFGALMAAGQKAFNALTSGASSLISEIDSSNAAWKNFQSNLEILEWDSGAINTAKEELQDFAQKTVYSSSDMATTFAQLAAVGVKNTTTLVKGFGGLAAAAENPQQAMKTLSQQATQMAAKPKVEWADFKLMLEQTPAGIAAVAKQMGMSASEMVTAVQGGKIATEDFFNAISTVGGDASGEFYKMATEAKTVGQAMDGLTETLGNKLTPSFEVLTQAGISAVDAISSKLAGIDADSLADKVSSAVSTVEEFLGVLRSSFEGVGTAVGDAFSVISEAITGTTGEFSKTDAIELFRTACENVAGAIKTVSGFITENQDAIQTAMPYVTKLAVAFAAYKVISSVAPGLTSFAGALIRMSGKGVAGLAAKLLGIAGAQKATGAASAASAPSIMQSAVATLALGAAVLLASTGLALLVQSSIALVGAGWPAVAALIGLVGAIALLAAGAAVLGPVLTAGAAGFIAFGAAIALVGAGALMAAVALQLVSTVLPVIVSYGLQGSVALLAMGASLIVFGAGALVAGAGCIVLGAGLLVVAAALVIAGAGMLLVGTGALLAVTSIALLSAALPTIATYGTAGAVALLALGAGLIVFSAGALVAAVAVIALGVGFLAASVGILLCAAGMAILAASMLIIGVSAGIAGAAFAIMAATLPLVTQSSVKNAASLAILSAGLVVLGAGAAVAGAAFLVLGAGLLVAGAGAVVLGAGIMLISVGALLASGAIALLSLALPTLASNGTAGAGALVVLGAAMTVFAVGAGVAGAAALLLSVGLAASAISVALLGAAVIILGAGILIVSAGFAACALSIGMASGAMALFGAALPKIIAHGASGATAMIALGAGLLVMGAGAVVAGASSVILAAGLLAVGAGALVAGAGMLVLAAGTKMVSSQMKTIAKNASDAEESLYNMQESVSIVENGLDALGSKAKSALKSLIESFDSTAKDAKSAGKKVGDGFSGGMSNSLVGTKAVAVLALSAVVAILNTGKSKSYQSGAYMSQGFATGMLSEMRTIESASNRIVIAADKAIRAKAKIHSPSKVSDKLGSFWGSGFVNGIIGTAKDVWNAAQELVSLPNVAVPDLAIAYDGSLSGEYDYYRNSQYTIEVPLYVDGREFAKANATYMQDELDRRESRNNRKHGIL